MPYNQKHINKGEIYTMNFQIKKEFADIKDIGDSYGENENKLRIWCKQSPDQFNLQIRTRNPLKGRHSLSGKNRNFIATVSLSVQEMEEILAYMKSYARKHE